MQVTSQEHYNMMADFERQFPGNRFDKEPKAMWAKKAIYQNGEVNNMFLAFRAGYSTARCEYLHA